MKNNNYICNYICNGNCSNCDNCDCAFNPDCQRL